MGQTDNSEANGTPRPLSDADVPALVDLWVAAWQKTMPTIDFEARRGWITAALADAPWRTLVVEADGSLAGFAAREGRTMHQLLVGIDWHGRGVARRLLDAVKAEAPDGLELEVNRDNARAAGFYAREGFRKVGEGINPASGLATWTMRWP